MRGTHQMPVLAKKAPGPARQLPQSGTQPGLQVRLEPSLRRSRLRLHPRAIEIEDDRDEGVLVFEPAIDRSHRHAGFAGDFRHGNLGEGLLLEKALQRGDQLVARFPGPQLLGRLHALTCHG